MRGIPLLLRAEWVALGIGGVVLFLANGGPWWLLLPALLAPDLSMAGYLAGPRLGAITYNAVHNLVLTLAAIGAGWWADTPWLLLAGANAGIWRQICSAASALDPRVGFVQQLRRLC